MNRLTALIVIFSLLGVVWSQSSHWLSYQSKNTDVQANQHIICSNDSACPTWFICDAEEEVCHCRNSYNDAVVCDEKKLMSAVLDCYCVTYDEQTESTHLGTCFYNCEYYNSTKKRDVVYLDLPESPKLLVNNSACTYFNRTGLLCGDCEDGHSPLVLSYSLSCVKCPDGHKNWWKFILVAFVPLTFFYFFVVVFNINVTSSRLHGVVWFSQALSIPILVRLVVVALGKSSQKMLYALKVLVSFYSFWNLDFLRIVLPNVCLNVSTLQALAMDYLVALYPYVLIPFTYLTIEL